ncbi:MAG: M20/M25/M40 family metallo-hydrolase, partial [Synergistales bacterium]|nr:M20/M25/M40 family metallo-hydrolase [Synergistales bacterium]
SEDLVRSLVSCIEGMLGVTPRMVAKGGSSDGNLLAATLGVPVVAYGPGNGSAHGVDEFTEVADLAKCTRVIAVAALEYLRMASKKGGDSNAKA